MTIKKVGFEGRVYQYLYTYTTVKERKMRDKYFSTTNNFLKEKIAWLLAKKIVMTALCELFNVLPPEMEVDDSSVLGGSRSPDVVVKVKGRTVECEVKSGLSQSNPEKHREELLKNYDFNKTIVFIGITIKKEFLKVKVGRIGLMDEEEQKRHVIIKRNVNKLTLKGPLAEKMLFEKFKSYFR